MTKPEPTSGNEVFDAKLHTLLRLPLKTLQRLAVSANGFVFDPSTGQSYMLNETGLDLLHRLQQAPEPAALIESLLHDYAVTPRALERDLLEFVGSLREHLGV